ncbi:hypothetical protein [Ralstonia phage RSL2]|uniref:Uncharacterized protein n=1 Tax=Ralstonia phage RSL2 TaxID=1585840 RepID=A0A146I5E8_9CAUD|nr:hypothetical protein [Ralstonia phage RSL2]
MWKVIQFVEMTLMYFHCEGEVIDFGDLGYSSEVTREMRITLMPTWKLMRCEVITRALQLSEYFVSAIQNKISQAISIQMGKMITPDPKLTDDAVRQIFEILFACIHGSWKHCACGHDFFDESVERKRSQKAKIFRPWFACCSFYFILVRVVRAFEPYNKS